MFRLMVLAMMLPFGAAAQGLCDCTADCAERADPTANRTYDNEEHRLWYEARFWGGACRGKIWLTCWSGPSWYEVMNDVLSQTQETDRPEMCQRLYRLGERMGYEWARDNDIRTIHTADLEAWQSVLLGSDDPMRAISETEALVDDRLK